MRPALSPLSLICSSRPACALRLSKARNEHGKARSEKAVLQDRLEADRARHASEVSELRAQLAQQAEALKVVEREKQNAREALAASKGEISGLEKRLAAQVRPASPPRFRRTA